MRIVEALLEKQASVNATDKESANLKIVKALVVQGTQILMSKMEREKWKYNKRKGTSGISGQLYEIELSMLFLLQGIMKTEDKKIDSFFLATNMVEAGDFDDVVFKYSFKNEIKIDKSKLIFLQAKHKENPENPNEKITIDRLFSETNKKDTFSVKDYFYTYRQIKKRFSEENLRHPIFGSKFEDCDFIIFTNALPHLGFNENKTNIEKVYIKHEDFLNIKDSNHYYKLILGGDKKIDEKIISALQYSSDCKKLAQELVLSFFPNGIQKSAEIVYRGIIKNYYTALVAKVIEKKSVNEGKISTSFLDGDESISTDSKLFRSVFFEEIQKKKEFTQKTIDELKIDLRNKNIKLPDLKNAEKIGPNSLPIDLVDIDEITEFLSKLKLFISQPNESDLGQIIKEKIQSNFKVEENDINAVFSDVKNKVERWWVWKEIDNDYLNENNTFYQDSVRVSIQFDVWDPIELFTGRLEELSELHSKIHRNLEKVTVISQITSISGLGGIGKTELAKQYIHKYSQYFDNNLIWINAASEETFIDSFRRLAQDKLRINMKNVDGEEKDIKSILEEVYKFFSKRKCIFVFDNAEKNKALNKFLPLQSLTPDAHKPYVLITSRENEWKKGIEVLELKVFNLEEAVEFVKKGLGMSSEDKSQDQEIKKLVEKLQRFPLAIQQAIAYIEDQELTRDFGVCDYVHEYENKTKKLLDSNVFQGIDNNYTKTTFTTWQITIDKIRSHEQHGQLSIQILNIMAYYAPDKIKRKLFLNLADGNEEQLQSAVRSLVKYSMVYGEQKQSVLNIHRLVQEVIRLGLQDKECAMLRNALSLLSGYALKAHIVSVWSFGSNYNELIKDFIVNNIDKKRENNALYFISDSGQYKSVQNILNYIENIYPSELGKIANNKTVGKTCLHAAAKKGNLDVVKCLVKKGANVNVQDDFNCWTPLHFAVRGQHLDVVKCLIENGADFEINSGYDQKTPLHFASSCGNLNIVKYLAEKGANLNACDNYGHTPIHLAAENGNLDLLEYLIKKVQVNVRDNYNWTPLHVAAQSGNKNVVEFLIKKGAKINDRTSDGETVLHIATIKGHKNIVEYLLKNGADVDAKTKERSTLLHSVAKSGNLDLLEYLIEKFELNVCNDNGWTPLHVAAENGHQNIVEYLIKKGAKIIPERRDKNTILHLAAKSGNLDLVKYLIEIIDVNACDDYDQTCLHTAAKEGHQNIVDYIIAKGAHVDAKNKNGETYEELLHRRRFRKTTDLNHNKKRRIF